MTARQHADEWVVEGSGEHDWDSHVPCRVAIRAMVSMLLETPINSAACVDKIVQDGVSERYAPPSVAAPAVTVECLWSAKARVDPVELKGSLLLVQQGGWFNALQVSGWSTAKQAICMHSPSPAAGGLHPRCS